MTVQWDADMIGTLRKMRHEQRSAQAIADRLGIDRSVVIRYCETHNIALRPVRRAPYKISGRTRFREAQEARAE